MKLKFFFIPLSFFLFCLVSEAQKYNFEHYSIEDGLVQSNINAIYQDSKGYLWIGTRGGVSRFDGKEFKNWTKEDGLPSNNISSFSESKGGDILIGTNSGLAIVKDENLSSLKLPESWESKIIMDLQFYDNKVWILTPKGLLFYQNGELIKSNTPKNIENGIFRRMAIKSDGAAFINVNGATYKYQNNQWDSLETPLLHPLQMISANDGSIWYACWNGHRLSSWNGNQLIDYPILLNSPVTDVFQDYKNRIWVTTWDKGVFRIDDKGLHQFTIQNGLPSNSYWCINEDSEHNIWLGSFNAGLIKFTEDPFFHYEKDDGLPSTVVLTLFIDSKGLVWVGTDNGIAVGKLIEGDKIEWQKYSWMKKFEGKKVIRFYEQKNGDVAVGVYDNEILFTTISNNKIINSKTKNSGAVFSIFEDSKDNLWVGTDLQGAYKMHPHFKKYKINYGGNRIMDIAEDHKGNIWFATSVSGLNVLIKDSLYAFNKNTGFNNIGINNFLLQADGTMWMGTDDKGILIAKIDENNKLQIIDSICKNNGAYSNQINGLLKDEDDNIWVQTEKGLMVVKKYNGLKWESKLFTKTDGFIHPECGENSIAILNNNLWVATSNGITVMKMKFKKYKPILRNLKLINVQQSFTNIPSKELGEIDKQGFPKSLTFNYNQNHLTFNVHTIYFQTPKLVRYSFRMKNLDKNWSPLSKEGKITYSSLPPGKYILQIKSGILNDYDFIQKEIIITITPPIWQTTGFIIFSIIFILLLIFLIIRLRTKKLRKDRKKLENTVSERTEELVKQKSLVEIKNQEITDSISYAKRIQQAILPPNNEFKKYLNDGFIFYQPKDIVAGDFYWLENIASTTLFAAADCTGHGVPGAMVSVVCHNALNRAVREYQLKEPAKILEKVRVLVIETFEKSEEEVKDGMDIAICSLKFLPTNQELDVQESDSPTEKLKNPKTIALLEYAGANNPLYIIKKGEHNPKVQTPSFELIETKPNKQPIGKTDNPLPFTTHTFELQKGDTFYIFTDGFADQFGGEKGKKFKYRPFKELLLSIQHKTMNEQKDILKTHFINWKGDLEQIDDVCVIGVKI